MTKAELIEKLQKGSGKSLSKKAIGELVDEVFEQIQKSVKKEKTILLSGLWNLYASQAGPPRWPQPSNWRRNPD